MSILSRLRTYLPRWVQGVFHHSKLLSSDDASNPPALECYACTQATGAPAFHSTTCDRAHSPEYAANAGSSLIPIQGSGLIQIPPATKQPSWKIVDPRSEKVKRWNKWLLLARGVSLAIDPFFFYAFSIGREGVPCLYVDEAVVAVVTVVRSVVDLAHLVHVGMQFRMAYVSRESLVVGCGKLVWDARMIADHYLRSVKGFWFDMFVILPIPQMVFYMVVPKMTKEYDISSLMTMVMLVFLFQFLPKVYHNICVMRRMQKVIGYVFGTIWWGFALNLIAYFVASHVTGGCWYVLAIQRIASCLQQQCETHNNCDILSLACSKEGCYNLPLSLGLDKLSCRNLTASVGSQHNPVCFDSNGPYPFGIYNTALAVVSSNSLAVQILYPIFWGIMTLSTFGNDLEPTSNWLEVIFSIINTLCGLMLFTLLIGNIQVFLHAVMAGKRKMQIRCRNMEWWMKRRQLPSRVRQRVRQHEYQKWETSRGEDEIDMIQDLPEGLRRDIKRQLCLDLVKQVPLFHNLDNLILDNICDRVKPLLFTKNEKVIREGDPVQRMVFIVRGNLQSSQRLSRGTMATCLLGPGNFLGDELLSWCLRRPFIDHLPASSATYECVKDTEAFALDAPDLRYITEHFRYKFANERLKRTARYYSSTWRTWAAINIQLAWRRYRIKTRGLVIQPPDASDHDSRLWRYAAMFMSLRPQDHLE